MLLFLFGCTDPQTSWPGLVLLDRSALDAQVAFLAPGAPLRTTEAPLVVDGQPESFEAERGELLWITWAGDDLAVESWQVGEDLDPDAVDVYTRNDEAPVLSVALDPPPVYDPGSGAWRISAPDALLSLATTASINIVDVVPVAFEAAEASRQVPASARSGGAPRGVGTRAGTGDDAEDGTEAIDGTGRPVASELSVAAAFEAQRAAAAAAAPLVGLHEAEGRFLLLRADLTWSTGLDPDAPGGGWRLEGSEVFLDHQNDSWAFPFSADRIDLTDFPY